MTTFDPYIECLCLYGHHATFLEECPPRCKCLAVWAVRQVVTSSEQQLALRLVEPEIKHRCSCGRNETVEPARYVSLGARGALR